ncbi:membrane-bound PQQ-dependent dehydrogenase, glucose/quinate/shikimate family [Pigmentiphaga aceris]|uniref:Membrane-bound PQQ-dependent dehydrogenase, glucose/quinate/shikimate family n=1 Tax=Pigmentiphaga aceris TaxID=1940612 RepID=A0A5C0B1B1_9BURK|nr:membrane-bound PQQ-dependent dehydrogenase, glucose/quinate/shikimate family [Pigmentiphaga aceris]QEI06910.1 membrane-bound PQQ-dependent dehydrogenase, glucose/quinate/shikimate family [Pigmentiphaga aceris]
MTLSSTKPGGIGRWLFALIALVVAAFGLGMLVLGGKLVVAGGTWYYAIAGAAFVVAGALLAALRRTGVLLFGVTGAATLIWATAEVGFDGWALIPRLAWLSLLGLMLFAFWPVARHGMRGFSKPVYLVSMGVLPLTMLGSIVVPLFNSPHVELASTKLARDRPAVAFSRLTVESPDGNVAANHDASNWTSYGGSNLSNKYSPSAQITPANVSQLEEAWHFHTGDLKPADAKFAYAFQNTPLKVKDTVYVCTPSQIVIALDAAKGTEKWRFDPQTSREAMSRIAASTCRGVAYFEAKMPVTECPTRIVWPMVDGRVGAIDAATGKLCTGFGTNGYLDLNDGTGNTFPGFVAPTSPPLIMRGTVIIGTGQVRDGTERDAPSGVVRGYDAITGAQRWAWDLGNPGVSTPPKAGEVYTRSTPNVWSLLAGDDELGLVYLPTGNPASDFYGADRTKLEDEYTAALVALDASTGEERWHFRTVNHDLWDFDLSPQPNLVDFPTAEGTRPAVVQATKSGQIYVLDRATGEPIMPVVEMPVPQGTDTPDWVAKTQPLSPGMPNTVGPPSKAMEVLDETAAWGITPFDQLICRIQFKQLRYDGPYTPPTLKGSLAYAGNHGGVNWGGVSIDPVRGLMLMNSNRLPYTEQLFTREKMDELGVVSIFRGKSQVSGYMPQKGSAYGARKEPWMSPLNTPCIAPPWGYMSATDLRTQEVIWSRPLGTGYDSGPLGVPSRVKLEMGTPNNSGSLATAGGMTFVGAALDQFLRGYNSETGELLWEVRLPAGAQANPMSYEIDGRQYIVAAVGGHQRMDTKLGDSVIAWALPKRN